MFENIKKRLQEEGKREEKYSRGPLGEE